MYIEFIKCQGSGNDFILIDEMEKELGLTDELRSSLAKTLCDRNKSVGADGILFVLKSERADCRMRIFNSDGSEALMCGNGIRCVGRFASEKINKDTVKVETSKKVLTVIKSENIFEGVKTYEVSIEPINFNVNTLPLTYEKEELIDAKLPELSDSITFTALSVPNPHIIAVVSNIDINEISELGHKANNLKSLFKEGVNLSFVLPLKENTIYVQTYERGVGLTNACGTGMSASSLATCKLNINRLGSTITVFNRGGMVKCRPEADENGSLSVKLIGNATYEFKGKVNFDGTGFNKINEYDDDRQSYEKLLAYSKNILL